MPGTMPYHLEKGPYFSVLEDFCNKDRGNVEAALRALRSGAPIPDLGGVIDSQEFTKGPYSADTIKRHLYEDWFDFAFRGGAWTDVQEPFHPVSNPTTGYWSQYYGDVEGLFRETLVRAAEVVLGIDHGAPIPAGGAPRHLTIEAFWKCGQPWWEGWVTWRQHPQTATGQVTVILATPGTGDPVLRDPTKGRTSADFQVGPTTTRTAAGAERNQGMWIVTHKDHKVVPVVTSAPSAFGSWTLPTIGAAFKGEGGIVVVQPSEADGGVLATGRPFVAAP